MLSSTVSIYLVFRMDDQRDIAMPAFYSSVYTLTTEGKEKGFVRYTIAAVYRVRAVDPHGIEIPSFALTSCLSVVVFIMRPTAVKALFLFKGFTQYEKTSSGKNRL